MRTLLSLFNKDPLLSFILLTAAIFRFWGIGWGNEYFNYHADAGFHWNLGLRMLYEGTLEPKQYVYGPVYTYIIMALTATALFFKFIFGYVLGFYEDYKSFLDAFLLEQNYHFIFVLGQTFSAVAGVAQVYLTYLIGKEFFGRKVGLLAAFFLSLS